jgi:hypothetical protein
LVEILQRYANTTQNRKSSIPVDLEQPKSSAIVQPAVPQHIHKASQRLDSATIEQLVTDYRDGMPTIQLMSTYHLSKGTILRIMDAQGVPRRNAAMSPADQATAIRLYQQGWSLARVGAHLNRDAGTIQHVLIRAGVPRRDNHGRRAAVTFPPSVHRNK